MGLIPTVWSEVDQTSFVGIQIPAILHGYFKKNCPQLAKQTNNFTRKPV
jgi:hypothetical protein